MINWSPEWTKYRRFSEVLHWSTAQPGLYAEPEAETAAADTQGEGTEDPYSKAPDTAEAETADAKPPAEVETPVAESTPEEPQTEAKTHPRWGNRGSL